jgi:hypothetical protein
MAAWQRTVLDQAGEELLLFEVGVVLLEVLLHAVSLGRTTAPGTSTAYLGRGHHLESDELQGSA